MTKKKCSPTCDLFKCAQNTIVYRDDEAWCKLTEEKCDVENCGYAMCVKRRLLPEGICGETVERKTTEKKPEEVVGPPIKVRGKTLRQIEDKEIF